MTMRQVRRRRDGTAATATSIRRQFASPEGLDVEEATLIQRAQAGDSDAFGELYERHANEVQAFIRSRVKDRALGDDIGSATWLSAWRSVGRFTNDGRRFIPWVVGIAKYEILNHLIRSVDHGSLDEPDADGPRRADFADPRPSTEDTVIARAEVRAVAAAFRTLSRRRRTALLLLLRTGMSEAAIANAMGTTPVAVRFLLHRAREQLREHALRERNEVQTDELQRLDKGHSRGVE